MAKVIKPFFDLQDNNYEYKAGDIYPRKDYKPTKARIEELAGNKNKLGEALIDVEQPKEDAKPKKQIKKAEE
jgi:hypothetical protein